MHLNICSIKQVMFIVLTNYLFICIIILFQQLENYELSRFHYKFLRNLYNFGQNHNLNGKKSIQFSGVFCSEFVQHIRHVHIIAVYKLKEIFHIRVLNSIIYYYLFIGDLCVSTIVESFVAFLSRIASFLIIPFIGCAFRLKTL